MDKYEYNLKLDQIKTLCAEESYQSAADIADTINWNKVRNVNALVKVGEVYEKAERYSDAREILLMAYDRSPIGRMIIYRLAEVAIKMGDYDAAMEYYDEFVEIAPHDDQKYVLRYSIKKGQGASIEELISILEEFKEQEYTEEWAYELAYLYHKAGITEKCIEACDELILWFGDGPYVERALELKMLYQPLSKEQEEKYRRFRLEKEGKTHINAEEMMRAGEFAHDEVTIPQVTVNQEKFNTINLQEEIARGMQQIIDAKGKNEVDDTMDNIKKIVEDIPYLQLAKEKDADNTNDNEDIHIATDEEIDGSLKINFNQLLGEDSDGQMSLVMNEKAQIERQITGQMSIQDVLDEWEKTRQAAEIALKEAEQQKLESAKARALQEAGDIMERLNDVIPKLDAGVTPKELLEEEYLQHQENNEEYLQHQDNFEENHEENHDDLGQSAAFMGSVDAVEQGAAVMGVVDSAVDAAAGLLGNIQPQEKAQVLVETADAAVAAAKTGIELAAKKIEASLMNDPVLAGGADSAAELAALEKDVLSQATATLPRIDLDDTIAEIPLDTNESEEQMPESEAQEAYSQTPAGYSTNVAETMKSESEVPETHSQIPADYGTDIEETMKSESEVPETHSQTPDDYSANVAEMMESVSEVSEIAQMTEMSGASGAESEMIDSSEPLSSESTATAEMPQTASESVADVTISEEPHVQLTADEVAVSELDNDEKSDEMSVSSPSEAAHSNENELQNDADIKQKTRSLNSDFDNVSLRLERELAKMTENDAALEKKLDMAKTRRMPSLRQKTARMPEIPMLEDLDTETETKMEPSKPIHELTDEQKSIFSYFIPVKGMEDQICMAYNGVLGHLKKDEAASCGNLIIQGEQGCGKTMLATSFVKVLQKGGVQPTGKIGKIDASSLNKRDVQAILRKITGGCLIIERAGDIDKKTAVALSLLMEHDITGTLYILEDTTKGIKKALSIDPEFAAKFTETVSVPIFSNDELVGFAKSYSSELGYKIDELAILALHNRISNIERIDQATTLTEVKEIVDQAIDNEAHGGLKKAISILTAKRYTEDDKIVLTEKDFIAK